MTLRLLSGLPPAAAVLAEAAWVALAAATVDALLGRPPALPLWATLLAAGSGVGLARLAAAGRGDGLGRWRAAAVALLWGVAGAILGFSAGLGAAPGGGTGFRVGVTGFVLRRLLDPSGWFLALAAWRGTRHGDPAQDDLVVSRLLAWGTPALTLPWLVQAWPTLDQGRAESLAAAALVDGSTFVTAGLLAVGLSRLEALHRSLGGDWRENRAWLGLLLALVLLGVVLGLPAAVVLRVGAGAVASAVAGPLVELLAAPLTALARVPGDLAGALGGLSVGVGSPSTLRLPTEGAGHPPSSGAGPSSAPAFTLVLLAGLVAAVVALALLRRRLRAIPPDADGGPPLPREDRSIVLPRPGRPRFGLRLPALAPARRRPPVTATEAYLDLLDRLRADALLARRPHETPAAHARRLRSAGRGSLALDLLAADVVLEQYAGVALGPGEGRRAIARWRRLRHALLPRRPGR